MEGKLRDRKFIPENVSFHRYDFFLTRAIAGHPAGHVGLQSGGLRDVVLLPPTAVVR